MENTVYPPGALRRVQLVQVEILKAIAAICEEFGLTWFVDGGTCLGAVRHQGFIPWDDDIDIGLPYKDYQVFCEIAPRVFEGTDLGLYTHAKTPNYPPLFAKVYKKGTRYIGEQMLEAGFDEGIFVDVFAYAQLDSNPRKAARQARSLIFWQRASYLHEIAHPFMPGAGALKPLLGAAAFAAHGVARAALTAPSIEARFLRALSRGDGKGPWTDVFYSGWGTFETGVLFPVGMLPFEDMIVPVPHDTHAYLTTLYGDYMQLPPEDQRCLKPPVILDFGDGVNVMEQ